MKVNNLQIIEALKNSGGFKSPAALMLNVSQSSLHMRIKKSVILQEALLEITESRLDIAETQLMQLVDDGNFSAIKYYLDNQGNRRGYGKGLQHGGVFRPVENTQMKTTIENVVENLSPDVKATLIQTMLNADISINETNTKVIVEKMKKNGTSK